MNMIQCFRSKCHFKIFLIWSSGTSFVQRSGTICVIYVEGVMLWGTILWHHFELRPVVKKEMLFKDISYLELWRPFCSQSRTICGIFVEGVVRNNSMKLFWISASGPGDVKKISYLELWWPSYSMERKQLCNFERGLHRKHSCEVIWNLNQWFRMRCHLKKKFRHDGQRHDGRTPDKDRSQ